MIKQKTAETGFCKECMKKNKGTNKSIVKQLTEKEYTDCLNYDYKLEKPNINIRSENFQNTCVYVL